MGYDDKNLYFAIRMEEPEMSKVKADITQHDGGVWGDDDIEIFLAPGGPTSPYLCFIFNSIGTTEESSMDAAASAFNAPWQCKVNREANAWTAELAIPFSSLGVQKPNPGAIWAGNIGHNRTHASQTSTWSRVAAGFRDTDAFGELRFLDKTLFNEVNIIAKPLADGVNERVEVRGQAGECRTRVMTTGDGVTQYLYGGFAVTPDKLNGWDNPYHRPDAMRITMMPELFEGPDVIFRGETTVVKEVDELTAIMAGIAKSLAGFPPDQAPAAFHDVAPTWASRLAALQQKPELIPAKALQQEIRAAQWAKNLPDAAAAQPVLLFPTNPFVEIWYDFLPDAATVGSPVTLQAMRGEYAPACVNVLPMDSSRDLLVSLDDLKGKNGATLPASAFDLRVLKAWYRDGPGGFQDPAGLGIWANELLLKDDGMISSNPTIKRNTIHYTKDAATLQPVKIDRFQTRQFWLTVHVPDHQAPGLYTGNIRVSTGGQAAAPFRSRSACCP